MDKNNIYYKADNTLLPLANADYKTFEYLDFLYAKDKNHIYYNEQVFPAADPKTFEVLKRAVAKDARHIFVGNTIFEGPDVKSFKAVDKAKVSHDFEDALGHKYWYRTKQDGAELIPADRK